MHTPRANFPGPGVEETRKHLESLSEEWVPNDVDTTVQKLVQHQLVQLDRYRLEMLRHIATQHHFLLHVADHSDDPPPQDSESPAISELILDRWVSDDSISDNRTQSRISFSEGLSPPRKNSLHHLCASDSDLVSELQSRGRHSSRRLSDRRCSENFSPVGSSNRVNSLRTVRSAQSLFDSVGILPVHEASFTQSGRRSWTSMTGQLWTPHTYTVLAHIMVNSIFFQMSLFALIVVYIVFVGIRSNHHVSASFAEFSGQPDVARRTVLTPNWMQTAELLFNVAFAAELGLRLYVLRSRFFCLYDRLWNVFDLCAVLLSFAEYPARALTSPTAPALLRRAAHTAQTLRILRFAPMICCLRFLTLAFLSSLWPLVWAAALIVFVLFSFAVVLQGAVAEYLLATSVDDPHVSDLQTYFSSLPMTLLTLFMSIFGGVDWFPVVRLLLDVGTFYGAFFLLFVLLTSVSLMNIITSVFVKDAMTRGETETSRRHLAKLMTLFKKLDSKMSDMITFEQLEKAMENPQVSALFATLDIDASDAETFFQLLDSDGRNQVEMQRFLTECVRLRGNTSLLHMELSILELRNTLVTLVRTGENTEMRIRQLTNKVNDMLIQRAYISQLDAKPCTSGVELADLCADVAVAEMLNCSQATKTCTSEVELADLFADVTVAEVLQCSKTRRMFRKGVDKTDLFSDLGEERGEPMFGDFVECWEQQEGETMCLEEGVSIKASRSQEILCLFGEPDLDSSGEDVRHI